MYSLQCIGRLDSYYQYRLSGIKSEYIGLFLILLIGLPLFLGYLKLRVLLVNEPFSQFGLVTFELEPPVVNLSAAVYVCA